MPDENENALRTALGRERMLEEHEGRLDDLERERAALDNRITDIERKEAGRDRRWDIVLRSVLAIASGIIIAVVSALIAGGVVHP